MPTTQNLWLFITTSLVLLIIPGPAVLYIFARSVEQGRLAGFVSVVGIHAATFVHVVVAALGLSAILASSALAFSVIKYAGAAYLIWLGLKKILGRNQILDAAAGFKMQSHGRLIRDGFLINLFNPKTAIFFLAFLPQFVDPNRGHVALQVITLGMIYIILGLVTDGSYAYAAGVTSSWLRRSHRFLTAERYVSGTLLIGLGVTAAFSGSRGKL